MFSAVMKVRDINKVVSDAQDCEHTCENVSSLKKKIFILHLMKKIEL